MLEHGGALREACARYGIAYSDWLDLSTGINPRSYPVSGMPEMVWHRLPEDNDGLEQAAVSYYDSGQLLPVAGSQAAIQVLPRLRRPSRVGILAPSYGEHAHAWHRHGHDTVLLNIDSLAAAVEALDVMVVVNPNNPTGDRFSATTLLEWRARLASRDGWLVVDEAFMDATPGESIAAHAGLPGLIVLRSLGKFFGLAGARVGFVLADPGLRQLLQEHLGPWTVTGPGRWLATQALNDRNWQRQTRLALRDASARLAALLRGHGLIVTGGTALFQWLRHVDAEHVQNALAGRGIWVRRFADPASLRFGLPGNEEDWRRLDQALGEISGQHRLGESGGPSCHYSHSLTNRA